MKFEARKRLKKINKGMMYKVNKSLLNFIYNKN